MVLFRKAPIESSRANCICSHRLPWIHSILASSIGVNTDSTPSSLYEKFTNFFPFSRVK
jgi:hypothetical protein